MYWNKSHAETPQDDKIIYKFTQVPNFEADK